MVVQGIWLVPMLETVCCEQTLKGVGKSTLDRASCHEQVCNPTVRLRLEAPVCLQWDVLERRGYKGTSAGSISTRGP